MFRRRWPLLAVAIATCLLMGACDSPDDVPPRSQSRPATPRPPEPSPSTTGYLVTDVRLIKTPDPVAQVVWSASFDARWVGASDAEPTRCRWKLLDVKNISIADGIVDIEGNRLDDFHTPPIYPDEFAGVPRSARVTC